MSAGDPFLDLSDFINIASGSTADQVNFFKSGLQNGATLGGTPVAGKLSSMWRWDGQPGAAAQTIPSTAVTLNNTSAGSLQQLLPATGAKKRFLGFVATTNTAGTIIVYDRLAQHGGLSGTATGAQTTNLPTAVLTRQTTGVGVELWAEIYTLIGSTGRTITASYTPSGGGTHTTQAVTIGGTGFEEQDRILPMSLASGDKGVTAVASATLSASTGTAGNFGLTLAYVIAEIPMVFIGVGVMQTFWLANGGPKDLGTNSDAAIAFLWYANGTTAPSLIGSAYFCEK
jgi:hypothetical protein